MAEPGWLFVNPQTHTVFIRVEGGYHAVVFGDGQPARDGQTNWLYKDGEGRTGPLQRILTLKTETEQIDLCS